jgi:hypothetical protein
VGEVEEQRRNALATARILNAAAIEGFHLTHRYVRGTVLFGKHYDWYVELATGKVVLVGPIRNG